MTREAHNRLSVARFAGRSLGVHAHGADVIGYAQMAGRMGDDKHRGQCGGARYLAQNRHELFIETLVESRCRLIEN